MANFPKQPNKVPKCTHILKNIYFLYSHIHLKIHMDGNVTGLSTQTSVGGGALWVIAHPRATPFIRGLCESKIFSITEVQHSQALFVRWSGRAQQSPMLAYMLLNLPWKILSQPGFEPGTFGLEIQRAIHCATRTRQEINFGTNEYTKIVQQNCVNKIGNL